jgi:perosamine synthetase
MVLTDDPAYAETARSLRNLCFRAERRFYHTNLGHNFRMTNMQAAVGVAQVERMDEIIAKKRWMGQTYTERLQDIPGLQLPVEEPWARQVYWMYGLVLDESTGLDAGECARRLLSLGVQTRPFFLGLHEQPVFLERGWFEDERYPVTERIARQGLYLPSGLALTESQLEQVCEALRKVLV